MSTVHNLSTTLPFRRLVRSKRDAFDTFLRNLEETVKQSHSENCNELSLIPLLIKGLKKFKKESSNWIPVFSVDFQSNSRFFRVSYKSTVGSIFCNSDTDAIEFFSVSILKKKPKVTPVLGLDGINPQYKAITTEVIEHYNELSSPFILLFSPIFLAIHDNQDKIVSAVSENNADKISIEFVADELFLLVTVNYKVLLSEYKQIDEFIL